MENDQIENFTVEAKSDYSTEKLKTFFEKKGFKLVKFEELSKKDKITTYKIHYVYTSDILIAIETLNYELKSSKDFKIVHKSIRSDFKEIVNKKLGEIKQTKKITYNDIYEQFVTDYYVKQTGAVGLEFIDQNLMSKQRSVMTYLLKTVGSNILSGKSIMNVSLPINIFDCRSTTEIYAYNLKVNSIYLEKATETNDKIERLKFISTFIICGLHCQMQQQKPFNPILGETFQAKIGDTMYYSEQVTHHPPVFVYYAINPKFKLYGCIDLEAITGANSVTCTIKAPAYIEFNDGAKYRMTTPTFQVTGTMIGRRFVNYLGSIKIEDMKNKIISYMTINPDTRSFFGKLFSKDSYPDYVIGFIAKESDVKVDKNKVHTVDKKNEIESIEGEWTRFINIGGVCYWRQDEQKVLEMERMNFTLPSDCNYRDDLILLKMGLTDKSQEAKVFLEEIQRKDKSLRSQIKENKK